MAEEVLKEVTSEEEEVTVRLRTTAAQRFKKGENAMASIWKILQVVECTCRNLTGAELLPDVDAGVHYREGVKRRVTAQQKLAACTGGEKAFGLSSSTQRRKEAPRADHDVR